MAQMSEQWFSLHGGVHYLGYHTQDTMSYSFDQARNFTLVTSNAAEVNEIDRLLKRGGKMRSVIWIIEGVSTSRGMAYYLREAFFPCQIDQAVAEHYLGARKKFDYTLDGCGDGQSFGRAVRLDGYSWFPAFLKDNGNFGFGLRLIRDEGTKKRFMDLTQSFFEEKKHV